MHKVVNGRKVPLQEHEVKAFQDEWIQEDARVEAQQNAERTSLLRELDILRASGLKDDAIVLLRPSLQSYMNVEKTNLDVPQETIDVYKAIQQLRAKGFDDETIAIIYPAGAPYLNDPVTYKEIRGKK